jgi:hypothetical protein
MKRRERKEKRLCTFHCYYPVVKNEQRKKRKTRKNTERERGTERRQQQQQAELRLQCVGHLAWFMEPPVSRETTIIYLLCPKRLFFFQKCWADTKINLRGEQERKKERKLCTNAPGHRADGRYKLCIFVFIYTAAAVVVVQQSPTVSKGEIRRATKVKVCVKCAPVVLYTRTGQGKKRKNRRREKGLAVEDRQMGQTISVYIYCQLRTPPSLSLSLQSSKGEQRIKRKKKGRDNTCDGSVMIPCLDPR